jgi:hypothetical protein
VVAPSNVIKHVRSHDTLATPVLDQNLIDWWTPKQHVHVYGILKPDFSMELPLSCHQDKDWATIMHLAIKKDNHLEA